MTSALFEEWKRAFEKGYRTEITFKQLVKLESDITLEIIKNNLSILVPNLKVEIFIEDYHDFSKNIKDILKDKEINNYNK